MMLKSGHKTQNPTVEKKITGKKEMLPNFFSEMTKELIRSHK